jgi:hydrogenase maturation protein HypF
MEIEGRRIEVRGTVQGVGFRPWLYRVAHEEGVSGRVRNDVSGVTIEAFGSSAALAAFLRRIETDRPPAAEVREVRARAIPPEQTRGFEIVASEVTGERRVSIPADLATCPECLGELRDPRDRRHRYAFTNCTHCGPRYTIARDVPYDRPATTMAGFVMCARCRCEYEDPADRRFHAQPIACPACGPRLRLLAASIDGATVSPHGSLAPAPITRAHAAHADPVVAAAEALRQGRIVAVKGLGGYHLACDAGSPSALRRLRERKHRDEKPFAVMVRDLEAARELAALSEDDERLLFSVERPIVLVRRRSGAALAPEVAPGNPLVGILLAYTPLHDLLLEAFAGPLVMTSGNLSEEPMAAEDGEARERLGGIADLFLTHDRAIENRCDDSVARVIAGRPTILRRSRGYVPRPIPLLRPVARPILACGAQLKNAFCLAAGDEAWLGPHIGDLDNLEAARAFEEQVERLQRFLGIRPEVIAHDLHPDYVATGYARRRPEPAKVAVQHHHAHVASALAEHGFAGPALGLAWDGTGYGTDGTAWGGELLLVEGASFERLATLRPIRLAGGDEAIRQVWRVALAALDDAFDGAPPLERLRLFDSVSDRDRAVVRQMLAKGLNAPLAHGAGRYFDAIGALGLARSRASYEGQVALEWNLALDGSETGSYPFELQAGSACPQADLRPLVRAAAQDVAGGVAAAVVSGRFHNAMADVAVALLRRAAGGRAQLPVVLTGGCFQNAELVERIERRLAGERKILRHGLVPPGDGGVALGQVLVADAVLAAAGDSGA